MTVIDDSLIYREMPHGVAPVAYHDVDNYIDLLFKKLVDPAIYFDHSRGEYAAYLTHELIDCYGSSPELAAKRLLQRHFIIPEHDSWLEDFLRIVGNEGSIGQCEGKYNPVGFIDGMGLLDFICADSIYNACYWWIHHYKLYIHIFQDVKKAPIKEKKKRGQ